VKRGWERGGRGAKTRGYEQDVRSYKKGGERARGEAEEGQLLFKEYLKILAKSAEPPEKERQTGGDEPQVHQCIETQQNKRGRIKIEYIDVHLDTEKGTNHLKIQFKKKKGMLSRDFQLKGKAHSEKPRGETSPLCRAGRLA